MIKTPNVFWPTKQSSRVVFNLRRGHTFDSKFLLSNERFKIIGQEFIMGSNGKMFRRLQKEFDEIIAKFGEQVVWLVLEGEYGGQVYLTIPWKFIGSHARICTLFAKFDLFALGHNDGQGRRAYLYWKDEKHMEMEREYGCICGVAGGMGGGGLEEEWPWLHEIFFGEVSRGEDQIVLDVIRGATCEQVVAMNWGSTICELLNLEKNFKPLSRSA